jgi:nitrogen regulatory protein P-II 1
MPNPPTISLVSRFDKGANMKLITAVIKPGKLDDVKQALRDSGVAGMTVTEASGFGRQKGHTEIYRGAEYVVDLIPKIKIELIADDDQAASIVETIANAANTNSIGDGKIWVTNVESVIRVRTGEKGHDAI